MNPDRVLIGGDASEDGEEAANIVANIYKEWIPEDKIILTNLWSSELSKLASNAFLAQRISSINSLSALCEKTGAKINQVSKSVGMDSRIGSKFLQSSVGFGGSCFKKDVLNLVYLSRYYNLPEVAEYWENVLKINEFQKERFAKKINQIFEKEKIQKSISILGWSFKKNTNDSRESASIDITKSLLSNGFSVNVYDPKVSHTRILTDLGITDNKKPENLKISSSVRDSLSGSYAICVLTEWDEFKNYDFIKASSILSKPFLFIDGRNFINVDSLIKSYKHVMSLDR